MEGFHRLKMLGVLLLGTGLLAAGCATSTLENEVNWYKQKVAALDEERNRLEFQLASCEEQTAGLEARHITLKNSFAALDEERRALLAAAAARIDGDEEGGEDPALPPPDGPADPTGFEEIPGVQVGREPGGKLRLTLGQAILFPAGSSTVSEEGHLTLKTLAATLQSRYPGRSIRVEGHTDNTTVSKSKDRFPSNWELSGARACAVLRALIKAGAADPSRSRATAFAAERPVDTNGTEEGRRANRRVEVVVLE
ncbi:MAG: flagellar motor protein MotB [Planctomycetota bacterium]